MFDGKDFKDNDLAVYKVINWETLEAGLYNAEVLMILYRTKPDSPHHQLFQLKTLETINGKGNEA
jgi:hypothetical protein